MLKYSIQDLRIMWNKRHEEIHPNTYVPCYMSDADEDSCSVNSFLDYIETLEKRRAKLLSKESE